VTFMRSQGHRKVPARRMAYGNAAPRRSYLRERVPQDLSGEMPGHGAPYGISGERGTDYHSASHRVPTPATPPLLKSVDAAQIGGPTGISPNLTSTSATRWTE
jgi:hypothetical protein